jgi:UTP--glucose-1-phosphate uridylyltransferase
MTRKVRRAVIPAAGLGSRLLPLTKAVPKELLPVGRVPMIHWCVAEAARSGIEEVVLIVRQGKEGIRKYFLEETPELAAAPGLAAVRELRDRLKFTFVSQEQPRGPGDAILTAAGILEGEPFALMYPDDIFPDAPPAIGQLTALFEQTAEPVTGLIRIRSEEGARFGNCGRVELEHTEGPDYMVKKLHDKGKGNFEVARDEELRWTGRHLLMPSFLKRLEALDTGAGELDDVGAFQELIREERMWGRPLEGRVFDAGNIEGYLSALVRLAGSEGQAYLTGDA